MTKAVRCSVPVALIIFNRPDLTARVFEAIRRVRPSQLFIIADGPRSPAEDELCQQAREIIHRVDWDCQLKLEFSEINLGCGRRPRTGIDWVFSQVEQAIILEDDCVPSPGFFRFCEQLLERYRDDERVMHIAGSNFLTRQQIALYSYYFSKYAQACGGWATWARAWQHMDFEMKEWNKFVSERSSQVFDDSLERKHWVHKLRPISAGQRPDVWDYQWQVSLWMRGGVSIVPATNLITNIGFRYDATHTRAESWQGNLPAGEMPEELSHPREVRIDEEADRRLFYEVLEGKRLLERRSWRYRISKPVRIYRKLVIGRAREQVQPPLGSRPIKEETAQVA
jgi:hypothetical protein